MPVKIDADLHISVRLDRPRHAHTDPDQVVFPDPFLLHLAAQTPGNVRDHVHTVVRPVCGDLPLPDQFSFRGEKSQLYGSSSQIYSECIFPFFHGFPLYRSFRSLFNAPPSPAGTPPGADSYRRRTPFTLEVPAMINSPGTEPVRICATGKSRSPWNFSVPAMLTIIASLEENRKT